MQSSMIGARIRGHSSSMITEARSESDVTENQNDLKTVTFGNSLRESAFYTALSLVNKEQAVQYGHEIPYQMTVSLTFINLDLFSSALFTVHP